MNNNIKYEIVENNKNTNLTEGYQNRFDNDNDDNIINVNIDIDIDENDNNGRMNNNGNGSNMCNNLPTEQLRRLCTFRRNNDPVYNDWIRNGKAWWFRCYPSNKKVAAGHGWEANPDRYPLPRWWWKYPEIPSPSIEWLCQNFRTNGNTRNRREYYLPNPNVNIPRRIDLRYFNPNCRNRVNDFIKDEISIRIEDVINMNGNTFGFEYDYNYTGNGYGNNYNNMFNDNNNYGWNSGWNVRGVQDIPAYTNEGFEGFAVSDDISNNAPWLFILVVFIIIAVLMYYKYK